MRACPDTVSACLSAIPPCAAPIALVALLLLAVSPSSAVRIAPFPGRGPEFVACLAEREDRAF